MEEAKKQFVLSLLAYAVQRDVMPSQLCKLAGIDLDGLTQPGPYIISSPQLAQLWKHAAALTGDNHFGLHFGESLQLAALGTVGEIIKSSHTVGEGIQIAASLTPLVTDLFTMDVTAGKRVFTISLIPATHAPDDFLSQHLADMLMVFIVHELDGLILEKIRPESFTLPFASTDIREYERILRCDNFKKHKSYSLTFDTKYWDVALLSSNHQLQQMLLAKARETVPALHAERSEFHQRVRQYIVARAYLGLPTLEEVAANFNITRRSMQRKLKDEGLSFQDIADAVRKSLALHYMQAGNYPVKEISHMLGYNDLSAFSRAFKRWTGKAPAHYQVGL